MSMLRKTTVLLVIVVATVSVSGCNSETEQKLSNCWEAGTKTTVTNLAKSIAVDHIVSIVKQRDGNVSQERRKELEERTDINMSYINVANRNKDADRLTCEATVNFKFTRDDKKTLTGSTSVNYDIARGESGLVFSVAKGPLVAMINSSSTD